MSICFCASLATIDDGPQSEFAGLQKLSPRRRPAVLLDRITSEEHSGKHHCALHRFPPAAGSRRFARPQNNPHGGLPCGHLSLPRSSWFREEPMERKKSCEARDTAARF